ncbi:intraflagellar transport protein 88 homolog [Daphnia pulicaria]|uniref:intraflagellar transport protein 88 homolog n=1 Tax=Daphnia pulicaria TaxID=35523 RepID=UPI001EEB55D2|nr:intraflagellar transport protein 88 homolog [Daphnia pulicaria]
MDKYNMETYDEDDLYSGFNEFHPTLNTSSLIQDSLSRDVKNQQSMLQMQQSRVVTASRGGVPTAVARPVTAIRGAGYTSSRLATASQVYNPLNQSGRVTTPFSEPKAVDPPEKQMKMLESSIHQIIEESIVAHSKEEFRVALDKAKEAVNKERSLTRQKEQSGMGESNSDIAFMVLFNLANQYVGNGLFSEAMSSYQQLIKNRSFANIGRLRLNTANLHFRLGQYALALKQYRMALDQVPAHFTTLRTKIMQNIGLLFIKMGQYNDACTSFEFVMQEKPDFKTGLHMVLSYYALADRENMRKSFLRLLDVRAESDDFDKLVPEGDAQWNSLREALNNDSLHRLERQAKFEGERCILMAAKLISPVIEDTFSVGYQWCVEAIKESTHNHLADDLEINKAVLFLRQKDVALATETLRSFEKRSSRMATNAAVNLSTIYYLQGDIASAEKYAEVARDSDPYNAAAFVCLGNCSLRRADYNKARDFFLFALDNDAACVEALYNLGLTYRSTNQLEKSLEQFVKLQMVLRHQPEVLFQVASLNEELGNDEQAIEWYLQVHTVVPSDEGVHQKLGETFDRLGDRQQAFQYYSDSYRHYPSNLEVIRWLAAYFTEMHVPEKAIALYERAGQMRPNEAQWPLAVASCTQRVGNYHKALQILKSTRSKFPENIECLRALIRLCTDLGLKEAGDYASDLRKLEHSQNEASQENKRTGTSVTYSSGRGSRLSSAASGIDTILKSQPTSAESLSNKPTSSYQTTPIDTSYQDQLGPLQERPKTSRRLMTVESDELDVGNDLLPL